MKKFLVIGMLVGFSIFLSLGYGIVHAQSLFEKADANKDGVVTRAEMKKALADRYKNEDANKDGKLTVDEYLQARQKNFDAADTNKDGVVMVEEWVVYWCGTAGDAAKVKEPVTMDRKSSRSQRMDTGKDGKIQPNECVAFWAGRFVDLDGNKDGKMTRDEYMNRMQEMAKMMDLDGDGVITIEEYNISWLGKDKAAVKDKKPAAGKPPAKK
jgi:Ca2+-binding EF-hand superfamily protein